MSLEFVVACNKRLLKKQKKITYFSKAKSGSLGMTNIYQIGLVPTEMVIRVRGCKLKIQETNSMRYKGFIFYMSVNNNAGRNPTTQKMWPRSLLVVQILVFMFSCQ
jgi:hypothetical protein